MAKDSTGLYDSPVLCLAQHIPGERSRYVFDGELVPLNKASIVGKVAQKLIKWSCSGFHQSE